MRQGQQGYQNDCVYPKVRHEPKMLPSGKDDVIQFTEAEIVVDPEVPKALRDHLSVVLPLVRISHSVKTEDAFDHDSFAEMMTPRAEVGLWRVLLQAKSTPHG